MAGMRSIALPVAALGATLDPLGSPPWKDGMATISREEVEAAVACGFLSELPCSPVDDLPPLLVTMGMDAYLAMSQRWLFMNDRDYHVARIAWLVANPDPRPIDLLDGGWSGDPGDAEAVLRALEEGNLGIEDGMHRLAAAMVRGDESIWARVPEPLNPAPCGGPGR